MTRHLIDDWRQAWRLWSVRMNAVGAALGAALAMIPAMPPEVQAMIPLRYRVIAVGLWAVASMAARLLRQKPRA